MIPESQVNILLVDDEPKNLLALEAILRPLGENLIRANSGADAVGRVPDTEFAAIFLSARMSLMDGLETARLIRSCPRSKATPIIFIFASQTKAAGSPEKC